MNKLSRIPTRIGGALLLAVLALGLMSAAAAAAPLISITKSDSLQVDLDGDGQADAGDTLRYTIVVTNNGTEALSVTVADTLDANLIFVPGSLKISPIAIDDAANVLGNVPISQAAPGVLNNDFDPDGGTLVALAASGSSVQGGNFSITADGSFSYNPPAGYEGADSFDYTIQDPDGMTSTGTVNLSISGMLWFINNNAPICTTHCGRLSSPFNSMAAFAAANTGAGNNPAAGDSIFVYESSTAYSGPLTLLNDQRLVGQDASQGLLSLTGLAAPSGSASLPAMNTGAPGVTITSAASGLVLGQNNHLYGFSMGNTSGAAIQGSNFGTLSVRDVSVNSGGPALSLNSGGFAAAPNNAFISITSSGGANNVSLTNVTGTGSLGSGALSGATSHALVVDGGNGSLTYSGTLNNTNARPLLVQNKTGGSVDLNGAITGSAQGILLNNNTGATINLSGLLTLNTGVNAAFTATGGGTLSATHANSTIATTSGQAVNINGTSIDMGGVTFLSINANGGSNAITLTNAGSGGFAITGVGTTNGSGGTIQNITQRGISVQNTNNITLSNLTLNAANTTDAPGSCDFNTNTGCYAAVYLNTVNNAKLNNVDISNSAQTGINGLGVSNFTYTNGSISSSGSSANEDGIDLRNLSGAISLTNSSITTSGERGLLVRNNSGTISAFTISNLTVNGASLGDGALIDLQAGGSANATINVTGSTFSNAFSEGLQVNNEGSGTAAVRVSSSTFTNNNIGVNLSTNYNAVLNYNISGNTFTNARQAVNVSNVAAAPGAPYMEGSISNNQISATNSAAIALWVVQEGNGQVTTKIENNTITQFGDTGIDVQSRGGSGRVDATINGNTVNFGLLNFELAGIFLASGNGTPGETNTICVNLNGNNVSAGSMALGDYTIDRFSSPSTRFYIQGLAPSPTNISGNNMPVNPVGTYLLASNTATTVGQEYFINDGAYSAQNCAAVTFSAEPGSPILGQAEPPARLGSLTASLRQPEAPAALETEKALHNAASKMSPAVFISPSRVSSSAQTSGLFSSLAAPLAEAVNINLGTLPAGESITIIFDASITNPLAAGVNQVSNQASVSGSNFTTLLSDDPDTTALNDPTLTNISDAPDLTISKTDGGTSAQPGSTITYTLSYTNAGAQGASGVVLTEMVPANTTFNPGASTAGWICLPNNNAGSTCSLAIGSLNGGGANGSASFAVNVVNPLPAGVSQVSNSAQIGDDGANGADPTPANNSASDSTPVNAQPDLTLSKDAGVTQFLPGDTIVYTLSYTNTGNQGATNVVLAETVSANTTFNPGTSTAGWICLPDNNAGSTCSLAIGSLNGGGSGSALFAVTVSDPAPGVDLITNTASIGDDGNNGADPTPANNSATETTPLTNQAPMLLNLALSSPVNEGSTATLSGEMSDPNPADTFVLNVDWGNAITSSVSLPAGTSAFTLTHSFIDDNPSGSPSDLYTVALELLDSAGNTDTATITTTVNNVDPQLTGLAISPVIDEMGVITLTGYLEDLGVQDTFTLTVDWGDGITETVVYTGEARAIDLAHQYPDDNPTGTAFDSYSVMLTLVDDDSGSTSTTLATQVNNLAPVLSNLSVTPAINEAGTVTLTANLSDTGILDTFNVTIDWGDGLSDTLALPAGTSALTATHLYADDDPSGTSADTYNIAVNVSDDDGGLASALTSTLVNNTAPVLSLLTLTPAVDEGGWATLSGTILDPGVNDVITLSVDWGDGTTGVYTYNAMAAVINLTHQYVDDDPSGTPADGYTLTLSATDDDLGSNSDSSLVVTVNNVAPELSGVSLTPSITEGGTATLSGSWTDPGVMDTFTLTVDWGDGSQEIFTYLAGTASFSLDHSYLDDDPGATSADSYSVQYTLADDDSGQTGGSLSVMVNNTAPQLSELAISTPIMEGGLATLSGQMADPGVMDTFTLTVDWGDGSQEAFSYPAGTTSFSLDHNYLDDDPSATPADIYLVEVTLNDDDLGQAEDSLTISVTNVAPLVWAGPDHTVQIPDSLTFTGTITDPGMLDSFTITWDFGDGTAPQSGTLSPSHTYAQPGVYTATLQVTDDDGGVGQDTALVYVTGLTDLSITKVGAPDPVLSGNLLVYTLTVTNHGPFPAVGVMVTDTLPANVSFISATPGCVENGQVVCNLGTVEANTSLTITITVLVNLPSGSLINNVVVGAASDDPNPANNSASWVTNVVSSLLVIDDDFENGIDPRWCDTSTSVSPSGRSFLGQYSNQNVCLLLSDLPRHAQATISFDLYIIRSWDGNESAWSLVAEPFSPSGVGPDAWSLTADGQELLVTTFANWDQYDFLQAYPGTAGAGSYPARYGAEENNTLGYEFGVLPMDAIYHVTFTINHTDDDLLLDFAAWGLQDLGDESWGLDNVQVNILAAASQPSTYRVVFPLVLR